MTKKPNAFTGATNSIPWGKDTFSKKKGGQVASAKPQSRLVYSKTERVEGKLLLGESVA